MQRFAQVPGQHFGLRQVQRHLAQTVHVVAEGQQPGRLSARIFEGLSHPGGPGHLGKGADVGQTAGTKAGFEKHRTIPLRPSLLDDLPGFLKGPGFVLQYGVFHFFLPVCGKCEFGRCRIDVLREE